MRMPEGDRVLSQHEVDALLRAISAGEVSVGGREAPPVAVTPLDFRRPQRLSRQELHAIQAIHEPLARDLRDLLAPILRAPVECQLAGVEQVTLGEFAEQVDDPTALVVATLEPAGQSLLLEVDPLLAFPLVERMLGAGGPVGAPPDRPLRDIEWNLLSRVIDRFLDRVAQCWSVMMVARLTRRSHETSPQAVRALLADEAFVRVGFLAECEGRRAGVNLCLPSSIAERLVERRSTPASSSPAGGPAAAVQQAEVEVAARLAVQTMSLSDLEELAVGDVLVLAASGDGVAVEVGGVPKLVGRVGRLGKRRAVLVEDWADAARTQRLSQPSGRVERRAVGKERGGGEWGRVLSSRVEVRAVAGTMPMSVREVVELRPGSVIVLDRGPGEPIVLEAGGRAFASGQAVRSGDRLGVQVAAVQEVQKTLRGLS